MSGLIGSINYSKNLSLIVSRKHPSHECKRKVVQPCDEWINNFKVPVAFFYSGEKRAYHDSWAQKISSAYNSVELIKITGTGHNGIISDRTAWTGQTLPELLQYFKSLK